MFKSVNSIMIVRGREAVVGDWLITMRYTLKVVVEQLERENGDMGQGQPTRGNGTRAPTNYGPPTSVVQAHAVSVSCFRFQQMGNLATAYFRRLN